MYYGDNGVPLDKIENELVLEKELKTKSLETVGISLISILFSSGLCLFVATNSMFDTIASEIITMCLVIMIFSLCPVFVYFSNRAIEDGQLSKTFLSKSKHKHVPGSLVLAGAIVLALIFFMARFLHEEYQSTDQATITLTDDAGIFVLLLVSSAFLLMIALPRISSSRTINGLSNAFRFLFNNQTGLGKAVSWIGGMVSRIDSWFVYVVAPAVGVTQHKTRLRYGIIFAYLLPCALLAWFLPPPYGLFPIFSAFVIALSVTRRWSWVESDRAIILRNPKAGRELLKVGVDQDLRDEALLALLSLIFMLPLAMRQADMLAVITLGQDCLFTEGKNGNCVPSSFSFLSWLGFFGTELAKAVPFLDWVDIYNVDSNPKIYSKGPYSYHIVFAARAIVDLVFLGALLQAVSSSFKLAQHKKLFFDQEISTLDPIIEKLEFEKLTRKVDEKWKFSTQQMIKFKHYDTFRLSLLKIQSGENTRLHAVSSELLRLKNHTPSEPDEIFMEAVFQTDSPNIEKIKKAYETASHQHVLQFDILKHTLIKLNGIGSFTRFRGLLVGQLANTTKYPRTQELVSFFRDLAYGEGADSHGDVRKRLIPLLKWAAQQQIYRHWPIQTLQNMAKYDRAQTVRKTAQSALDDIMNSTQETELMREKEYSQ